MTDAELDALRRRLAAEAGNQWPIHDSEALAALIAEVRRLREALHSERGARFKDRAFLALLVDEGRRALQLECCDALYRGRRDLDPHFHCGADCLRTSFLASAEALEERLR